MNRNKVYAFVSMALMASPVLGQSDYPMPVKRDTYGDWVVECFQPNDLGQECQIYQRLLINGGSAIAMVATMAYAPSDASLLMQFALPLGINIENGAVINIDEDIELSVPISRCTKQGCIFEGVATPGLQDALLEGKTVSVTVIDPTEEPFVIPLSLSGFKDALAQLQPEVTETLPSVDNTADLTGDDVAEDQAIDSEDSTARGAEPPLPQVPDVSGQEAGNGASDIMDLTEDVDETDDTLRPVTGNPQKP